MVYLAIAFGIFLIAVGLAAYNGETKNDVSHN